MPEGDFLENTVGSAYHAAFDFLVVVSHPLDQRWTFYTEIVASQYFESHDSPVYILDEALTYALTPNLQLDFGGVVQSSSRRRIRGAHSLVAAARIDWDADLRPRHKRHRPTPVPG
jgi:Putative MetA-pathway of phenol degradation